MTTTEQQMNLSVKALADLLNISPGAVVKRIERGKLAAVKAEDGTWSIPWPQEGTTDSATDTTRDRPHDRRSVSGGFSLASDVETAAKLARLEAENEALRARLVEITGDRDFLRERLTEAEREKSELRQLQLMAMRALPDRDTANWWQRMTGRFRKGEG